MKRNELCKLCILRSCLSVPVVSISTQLWRAMALMDLCLHVCVKLWYSTCSESVQPLECKIYPDSRLHDLGWVMVWFQQLDGLG
jgi:hypothetical protein